MEESSSSSSSSYSFSSSISTASNYSIDSNSVGEEMSSGSSCCSMDNSHIDQFIRHDYSSKRREIEIARLNVMVRNLTYLRMYVCMVSGLVYWCHATVNCCFFSMPRIFSYVCIYCLYEFVWFENRMSYPWEYSFVYFQTQTSNQSTPTMSLPLPVPTPSPPSATGTTTSMFSPPSSYHRNGQSHDWNCSNMDDIHPFHAGDPDHLLHYEVSSLLAILIIPSIPWWPAFRQSTPR